MSHGLSRQQRVIIKVLKGQPDKRMAYRRLLEEIKQHEKAFVDLALTRAIEKRKKEYEEAAKDGHVWLLGYAHYARGDVKASLAASVSRAIRTLEKKRIVETNRGTWNRKAGYVKLLTPTIERAKSRYSRAA